MVLVTFPGLTREPYRRREKSGCWQAQLWHARKGSRVALRLPENDFAEYFAPIGVALRLYAASPVRLGRQITVRPQGLVMLFRQNQPSAKPASSFWRSSTSRELLDFGCRPVITTVVTDSQEVAMIELKIRKIGNSLGVVLPRDLLGAMNAKEGDALFASIGPDGGLTLTPYDPTVAEQVEAARDLAQRYRNALRELAK
ncbi:MAG: hypothetical protein SGJ21_03720 [Alphaproteobacteria bacterium]|nr:hypothetical protein [Alphaproteobacteria bacterium]